MAFEPADADETEERPPSTFKRSKRKHSEPPPVDPFTEKPPKSKKRKPLARVVVTAPGWHAWFDPASILWLPLPIALSVFVGSALFSLILPPVGNEDGTVNINIIFLTFSGVLAFLPLAFLLSHWMQIAGAWAQGNTTDPPFPDFDVGAILGDFINALPAAVFALLFSCWVYLLPYDANSATSAAAVLLFTVYYLISLLAVSLQSHALASNPISILMALLRMSRGRLAFLGELLCHLVIGFGLWRSIFLVWEKNWDVGILIWGLLWIYAFFSGARLMRATGIYYRKNAKRVGWFT